MLPKIVILNLMIFAISSVSSQNTFIASKYSYSSEYKCVTNSSNALSWISNVNNGQTNFVSRYLSEQNNFDNKITNDYRTTQFFIKEPWKLQNSRNADLNNIILDERWEEIPVLKITPVYGNSYLRYEPVLDITTEDFDIPISIRTEKEAHIFLCDGRNPIQSNCYWLLLQAFHGNASSIRKCQSGEIPSKNNVYANWPCNYRRVNITHPPNFLSSTKWSHFILSKHNQDLTLSEITDRGTKIILEWKDTELSVKVTNMILHTKVVPALWKIHEVDFLYSEVESTEINIGPEIFTTDFLCVTMYVLMCVSCSLKLSLADQKKIINDEIFQAKNLGWTKIKFVTENVQVRSGLKLLISTTGPSGTSYWAIDQVRLCQKQDFRILESSDNVPCQVISEKNDVIHLKSEPSQLQAKNNCPKDTIGDFCVPCNLVFQNCEQITICSKDTCSCSAGYYSKNCYYGCASGFYGFACQNPCGKCSYTYYSSTCDKTDGKCPYTNCEENYSGPNCDIPPSIIFANPPKIITFTYTEASVAIHDFSIRTVNSLQPTYYFFQFKKDSDNDWMATNPIIFPEEQTIQIQFLEPDTKYVVRGVIIANDNQWQLGPYLQHSEFTTKCDGTTEFCDYQLIINEILDISEENVLITPTNTTVSISFIQTSHLTCKHYIINIQQGLTKKVNNTYFTNLEPFTKYEIEISRDEINYIKEFTTTEGVPERVSNFFATPSNTSVQLKWTHPRLIRGEFKHYILEYTHISFMGCSSENQKPSGKVSQITTTNSITVEGLLPYSTYEFSVFVKNTKFQGPASTLPVQTSAADHFESEELPQEVNVTPDETSAILNLSQPNCEELRGPIAIKISTNCTNPWCPNQRRDPKIQNLVSASEIPLNNLIPFTNYELEVKFCRGNGVCDQSRKKKFRTKPAAPGKVRNLIVYTKNSTSISLRWEPPSPPNGILKEYEIFHYYGHKQKNTKTIIKLTLCKLWPLSHCTTLSNLRNDVFYTIRISARNEEPTEKGEDETITTQTQKGKPKPPYDLKIEWSDLNDLKLEWKHPNETNGDIKFFDIKINPLGEEIISERLYLTEAAYNLTYYFTINATRFYPTRYYQVSLSSNNGQESSAAEGTSRTPPDIPKLSPEAKLQSSNSTILLDLAFNEIKGLSQSYKIYVLVSGQESNLSFYKELEGFNFEKMTMVAFCNLHSNNLELKITLGENQTESFKCTRVNNLLLSSGTSYNISLVVINTYEGVSRKKVFSFIETTLGEAPSKTNSNLFGLLVLLLVIPLLAVLYLKRHDLRTLKNNIFKEDNTSTDVLDVQDEEIPLSHVTHTKEEKKIKIQPKPTDATTFYSKPVKITEFEKYVKESIRTGELERQHALFPRGQTKSWRHGSMQENKPKNRYKNLLAYDHSRVLLRKIDGLPNSDYINANYVDGHQVSRAYIATQGPKLATLDDFWRMVWQENVKYIANVANIYEGGKKKVEKYWPDINETLEFGGIAVQHVSQKVFADYEHRVFTVSHEKESRKLEQLHFTSWPDHGVPLYCRSLVPFLQKLLQIPVCSKSPILVHCSAGVGRTGTILLCDIALRMAAKEGIIDALRILQLLREQRPNMVDNQEQYKLAHLVILECLIGLDTSVPCKDITEAVDILLNNGALQSQIEYLKNAEWQDQIMKTSVQLGNEMMVVQEKNRFKDVVPEIQGRVFISRCPPEDETSAYINAVKVDGFRCPGRFIVTQQPLPNTLGDFWRLIDQTTTTTYAVIVSLNQINTKDKTSCHFWPSLMNPEMKPNPHITLRHINTLPLKCYDVITVHLCTKTRKEFLQVQIISLKNWAPRTACPVGIEEFLSFWEQIDSAGRGTNPIFVTCYDGFTASGLFVAMSFVIEKIKLEQVCDVCQAVRNVRQNRPQFVQELEQFEFLYKAAVLYVKGFESYANFD